MPLCIMLLSIAVHLCFVFIYAMPFVSMLYLCVIYTVCFSQPTLCIRASQRGPGGPQWFIARVHGICRKMLRYIYILRA